MKRLQVFGVSMMSFLLFSGSSLLAHPGHGNPHQEQTLWHYLLEPEHLFPVFAAVLIIGSLLWQKVTRDRHSDR